MTVVDGERLESQEIDDRQQRDSRRAGRGRSGSGEARRPRIARSRPGRRSRASSSSGPSRASSPRCPTIGSTSTTSSTSSTRRATPVDIGGPLILDLPREARGASLLEGSSPQATVNGARVTVTGPFAPGMTTVAGRHSSCRTAAARRASSSVARGARAADRARRADRRARSASPQLTAKQDDERQGQPLVLGTRPGAAGRADADVRRSPACRTTPSGRATWRSTLAGRDRLAGSGPRSGPPRAGARPERERGRADPCDFDVVEVDDVSRHFGRRRALSHVVARRSAPARSSACFGPNGAGKSTLLGMLVDARAADARARCATAAHRRARSATPCAARIGVLGHDLFLYARSHGAREPRVLRPAVRRDRRSRRASTQALARGAPDRSRATIACADSRAGCASGWRSSARSCTRRGSCCSTSRSPASTMSRRRCWRRAARLRGAGAIVVMATHDFESADGLVDRADLSQRSGKRRDRCPARAARCASATARALGGGRAS